MMLNFDSYSLFGKNLLSFIRPVENSIYGIYDPLGQKKKFSMLNTNTFTMDVILKIKIN